MSIIPITTAKTLDFTGLTAGDPVLADTLLDFNGTSNIGAALTRLLGQASAGLCEGRLTLTTGVPITTADVTGATNVLFTPYVGDRICIFDGTRLRVYSFAELTLALGTLVNAQMYDTFIFDNSGTLTLESAEWANATVTMTIAAPCVVTWTGHGMATGNSITFTTSGALPTGVTANTQYWITKVDANTFKLSTSLANVAAGTFITTTGTQSGTHTGHNPQARQTALVRQNGALYKSGALTRRFLGSFFTSSTTTTEDSVGKRFLSNCYWQYPKKLLIKDTTASWNYTTATLRQANAADANRVQVACWDSSIEAHVVVYGLNFNSSGGVNTAVAVGLDSTNTASSELATTNGANANNFESCVAPWEGAPGLGYHSLVWLEVSNATGVTTWVGHSASLGTLQTGMIGKILC